MRYLGALLGIACAIGLASPLIVAAIPNFRWWRICLAIASLGYLSLAVLLASMEDDGTVGHALGLGLAMMMLVPAIVVFAISFAIRARTLRKRNRLDAAAEVRGSA